MSSDATVQAARAALEASEMATARLAVLASALEDLGRALAIDDTR